MILFKPEHVPLILSGKKRETRRLWKKPRVTVGSWQKAKTVMLSKDYFAVLHICYRFPEPLLDITDKGARMEGYPNREEYLKAFYRINPKSPDNPIVWVVGWDEVLEGLMVSYLKEGSG